MKTKLLIVAAATVTCFGFGMSAASADETHCYTVASLKALTQQLQPMARMSHSRLR